MSAWKRNRGMKNLRMAAILWVMAGLLAAAVVQDSLAKQGEVWDAVQPTPIPKDRLCGSLVFLLDYKTNKNELGIVSCVTRVVYIFKVRPKKLYPFMQLDGVSISKGALFFSSAYGPLNLYISNFKAVREIRGCEECGVRYTATPIPTLSIPTLAPTETEIATSTMEPLASLEASTALPTLPAPPTWTPLAPFEAPGTQVPGGDVDSTLNSLLQVCQSGDVQNGLVNASRTAVQSLLAAGTKQAADMLVFGLEVAKGLGRQSGGCVKPFEWSGAFVGQMINSGFPSISLASEGPVFPAVVLADGKRAGYTTDGQLVQQVAGAQIAAVGETKIVLCPGSSDGKAQATSADVGSMSLYLTKTGADGKAVSLRFERVLTVRGMTATLDLADPKNLLRINLSPSGAGGTPGAVVTPENQITSTPATAGAISRRPGMAPIVLVFIILLVVIAIAGGIAAWLYLRRRNL